MPREPDDSTPRLSDEEVERILSHQRGEDGTSRERMRQFLKSELGWKFVNTLRRHEERKEETNREWRENTAAMKAYMLGTTSRIDFIYVLIGEFVVKLSQIEFWLRTAFQLAMR